MCVFICVCVCTHVHVCMGICVHTHVYMCSVYSCVRTRTYTRTRVHTHVHTHEGCLERAQPCTMKQAFMAGFSRRPWYTLAHTRVLWVGYALKSPPVHAALSAASQRVCSAGAGHGCPHRCGGYVITRHKRTAPSPTGECRACPVWTEARVSLRPSVGNAGRAEPSDPGRPPAGALRTPVLVADATACRSEVSPSPCPRVRSLPQGRLGVAAHPLGDDSAVLPGVLRGTSPRMSP